jgi:acyl-CoA hydrolase
MVAISDKGKPVKVPKLLADSDTAERRMREAELRRANRLAERDQILAERSPD